MILDRVAQSVLLRCFSDGARWQVEVDLVNDLSKIPLHESDYYGLGELLTICLAAAIVLDLNVQIKRAVAAVFFATVAVRANERFLHLLGRPTVMLFAASLLVVTLACHAVF